MIKQTKITLDDGQLLILFWNKLKEQGDLGIEGSTETIPDPFIMFEVQEDTDLRELYNTLSDKGDTEVLLIFADAHSKAIDFAYRNMVDLSNTPKFKSNGHIKNADKLADVIMTMHGFLDKLEKGVECTLFD